MKNSIKIILVIALLSACKKEDEKTSDPVSTSENYSSINDFFVRNSPAMQTYTIIGSSGGTITTPKGTRITLPANAFVNPSNNLIESGTITISFKDIYSKADMLLANIPTMMSNGEPLLSGGEFYIKVSNDNGFALDLAAASILQIEQPIPPPFPFPMDSSMRAFMGIRDTMNGMVWEGTFVNQVTTTAGAYIFDLYRFSSSPDSGSWCNSDNPAFFGSIPQTVLNIIPTNDPDSFQTQVYILFNSINSMIHVYKNYLNNNFTYSYAPSGFDCTIVAIGEKDGDLYSAFVPTTITNNLFINFTLNKTTTEEFKTQLNAVN